MPLGFRDPPPEAWGRITPISVEVLLVWLARQVRRGKYAGKRNHHAQPLPQRGHFAMASSRSHAAGAYAQTEARTHEQVAVEGGVGDNGIAAIRLGVSR